MAKYTNGNEPSKSNGNGPDKESDKEVSISEVGGGEPVLISEEEREVCQLYSNACLYHS